MQLIDVVDVTVPIQTITFVFGTPVTMASENDLFAAAQTVNNEIKALVAANEGVGSVKIEQRISELKEALGKIRELLDADAAPAPSEAVSE